MNKNVLFLIEVSTLPSVDVMFWNLCYVHVSDRWNFGTALVN